jgi:hypothetical protein
MGDNVVANRKILRQGETWSFQETEKNISACYVHFVLHKTPLRKHVSANHQSAQKLDRDFTHRQTFSSRHGFRYSHRVGKKKHSNDIPLSSE